MARATVGVWLNYATTVVFQILFAERYGSRVPAAAFVLVFGLAVALSGLVIAGPRSVLLPRLLTRSGELHRQPVRIMSALLVATLFVCGAMAAVPRPLAAGIAPSSQFSDELLAALLRLTAIFTITQIVAGMLTVLSLARGQRFVPAAVLALPSIVAVGY